MNKLVGQGSETTPYASTKGWIGNLSAKLSGIIKLVAVWASLFVVGVGPFCLLPIHIQG